MAFFHNRRHPYGNATKVFLNNALFLSVRRPHFPFRSML